MTSYWKPRWKNTVLFGSFKELGYRIDISVEQGLFLLRTRSGPGCSLELSRSRWGEGFETKGRAAIMDDERARSAAAGLLKEHFSRLVISPASIACYCCSRSDILPEGTQLGWCLSLIYDLWSAAPEQERRSMEKGEFLE